MDSKPRESYKRTTKNIVINMNAVLSVPELAGLIVSALGIQGVDQALLTPETQFFGDGALGIDSLDLLEISMVLNKNYGVKIKSDDSNLHEIFSNLGSLAAYITANRVK